LRVAYSRTLELSGYPWRLRLPAEPARTIEDLRLRKEGSSALLLDERSRQTEGGGIIRSCGDPQPGHYVAEPSPGPTWTVCT
jgi:hypothetical protein